MIDTHCHLDMTEFTQDSDEVISRALNQGIEAIISVGADLTASHKAIDIARRYECVYVAVGIHPHEARFVDDASIEEIKQLLKNRHNKKIVALGEIGLDYFHMHSTKQEQISAFEKLLNIAKTFDIPIIIHNRDADDDMKAILKETDIKKAVLHCFSSDKKMADWAVKKGFLLSFAGNLTFKKANRIREIAASIPDESIMLETDAPYLSPEPFRGKRNEPAYMIHTARLLAELRGVTLEDIDRITTVNAKRFFSIGEMPKGEIVYKIRDRLYLNITHRCTNACNFCVRFDTDFVKGHNLKLDEEPSADDLIKAIGNPKEYKEVVFCGLGEPTLRLDVIKTVARWVKANGGKVRLNTNGLGNLINQRNIVPELSGLIDSISISLNAHDKETYNKVCKPNDTNAYDYLIQFIKDARQFIPEIMLTVVDIPDVDLQRCQQIANEMNVGFKVRHLDTVG
ncbi:MAG: YchF/TatD family DNA exonuclease [Thermodesulfovibrionales bacterium]|nr:YchF/TatD family DNA exonuclease [Thermodesulfovibrionales bacterium]